MNETPSPTRSDDATNRLLRICACIALTAGVAALLLLLAQYLTAVPGAPRGGSAPLAPQNLIVAAGAAFLIAFLLFLSERDIHPFTSAGGHPLALRVLAWLGLTGYLLLVAALAVLFQLWWYTY